MVAGGEGGSAPAVLTVYCARAAEPFLDSIIPIRLSDAPLNVPPQHVFVHQGSSFVSAPSQTTLECTEVIFTKRFTALIAQTFPCTQGSESLSILRAGAVPVAALVLR